MLFDAVYASTVVHHFGSVAKDIVKKWGDVHYPGWPMKAAHRDDKHRCEQADAR